MYITHRLTVCLKSAVVAECIFMKLLMKYHVLYSLTTLSPKLRARCIDVQKCCPKKLRNTVIFRNSNN